MPVLICSENHSRGVSIAHELTLKTGKTTIIMTSPVQFQDAMDRLGGKVFIESVMVIAKTPRCVKEWDSWLNSLGLYAAGIPIRWVTTLH